MSDEPPGCTTGNETPKEGGLVRRLLTSRHVDGVAFDIDCPEAGHDPSRIRLALTSLSSASANRLGCSRNSQTQGVRWFAVQVDAPLICRVRDKLQATLRESLE